MLEGTWQGQDGSLLYLGPLDEASGTGVCLAAGPGQDAKRHAHRYSVTRVDEAARAAEIRIIFDDHRALPAVQLLTLSADGLTAERRLLGGGPALLGWIRLDPSASDTLTYRSSEPF